MMEGGGRMGRNLRGRWEAFISLTTSEETEAAQKEKHLRLEDFLHAFLLMSANPAIDREDLVNFCGDIHSVFNILVRQFMADIQELAPTHPSDPPNHASPPCSPAAPSPLMEFLLHGRGWLVLNALCNLSSQALDFSPDFVCLLVQFIEEAMYLPVRGSHKDHRVNIPRLDACILKRNFSKKSLMSIGFANSRRSTFRGHTLSNPPSPVRFQSYQGSPLSCRRSSKDATDSSDSDSGTKTGDRKSSKRSGSDSTPRHVYSKQAPLPKAALLGEVRIVDWKLSVEDSCSNVSSVDVDAFDLCLVLLSLLERLCTSEVMHSSKRNTLALFLAPKLTHLLTIMNSHASEAKTKELSGLESQSHRWSEDLICSLQRIVLRIVVSLCMYSCTQHYEAPKLASNGILFTLLQLVKTVRQKTEKPTGVVDVQTEGSAATKTSNAGSTDNHEAQPDVNGGSPHNGPHALRPDAWSQLTLNNLHYVGEILLGVVLLLIGVMHSCCDNQIVVTHAMALLNEFATNAGYTVTESFLTFVDEKIRHLGEDAQESQKLKDCIISLLCSLAKLLIATKRAKLEYVHKFQCLKRTHNTCDYTHYTHHHHSMFGISHSAYEDERLLHPRPKSLSKVGADNSLFRARRSKCCIAVIVEMLLGLLEKVHYKGTTVRILFALEQGGVCCCLLPKLIISIFLRSLKEQPVAMRSYLLSVLSKLILEQLGGGERSEGVVQGICEECSSQDLRSLSPTVTGTKIADHYMSSDSAICSDGSQHDEDIRSVRWRVLEMYTPLLMSHDEVLSQQISGHLLHLVRHSNMVVKEELYFNVILSCFRHSNADAIDGLSNLPCFTSPPVLEHIFCALPYLLNTLSAQVEFLHEGGLTQLMQLLDMHATRLHVLRVFEVLILSEESQGAFLKNRCRSDTRDSAVSTDTLSESGETCNVVQDFVKIVCTVLPYKLPELKKAVSTPADSNESDEDWLQSCEVIEDPIERVYRSTQNRSLIEEGKVAFAESLDTIKEVESSQENGDSFEEMLLMPDQLSKLSETTLAKAADVWRINGNLLLQSASYKLQFLQQEGDILAMLLLKEALVGLAKTWKMCEGLPVTWSPSRDSVTRLRTESEYKAAPVNVFQVILDIAGSLLRICLTLQGRVEGQVIPKFLENCKGILKQSGILQSALGRPVAEMLLKVAQMQVYVHPGTHGYSITTKDYPDSTCSGEDMLHWNPEELQEAVSSDSQSEVSDMLSTEEGYEADSEREKEGIHSGDSQGEVDLDRAELTMSQHTLLHPQVCLLLLELLEGTNNNEDSDAREFPAEVACYSIKQIIAIARSSQASQNSLYHCGLPKVTLQNYRRTVSSAERVLLLELFAVLVQHNLATSELREFLQLFPTGQPFMDEDLLCTLLTIVDNTPSLPSHILSFPIVKPLSETLIGSETHSSSSTASTITDVKAGRPDQATPPSAAEAKEDKERQSASEPVQVRLGVSRSPWYIAPVQLPVRTNLPWPPTGKGFFIAAWLKVDELSMLSRLHAVPGFRRRKSVHRQASVKLTEEEIMDQELLYGKKPQRKESITRPPALQRVGLHLFSVGNRDLMMQVWVEARTCRLTIRLTHFLSGNDHVVLHEKTCSLLSLSVWQHLTLGYEEKAEGSTRTGMITVIINGQLQRDFLVEYNSPVQAKSGQSPVPYCLLGHCVQEGTDTNLPHGSWQLGNVMLFNDARVLNQEVAFHLYSMGPDCLTVSLCEGSKQGQLYSQHITQDILQSAISCEIMSGDREVELRSARESLVITYSPGNKDVYCHYEPVGNSSGPLGRVLGGSSRSYPNALLQCPATLGAALLCTLTPHSHCGLLQAIKESGGIGVFVFLFAKIVEKSSSKTVQAKALKLIMRLRSCSHALAAEFNNMMAASMIAKVLVTPKCIVGFEMLRVMLEACLTKPVLYRCSHSNEYRLHRDTQAIIQDTSLVSQLLLAWRIWEKAEAGVLPMLFRVMESLIHADHPYQAFNITQLLSIRGVQRLLMICKERHHEDLPSLTPLTCSSVVSIIKGLMGQPPDINLLAEVCDFLLAIHPAVNTFVCHAQSSFYFSHHSFVQQKAKQKLLQKMSSLDDSSDQSETSSETAKFYLPSVDLSISEMNHNRQKVAATPDRENDENAAKVKSQGPFGSPGASDWDEDRVSDMSGLCSGLLNLLSEALVVLPDSSLSKVLGIVIKPETLIVLAHHDSPLIRTRVIQLLDVFFHRASSAQIETFLKRKSFHLLANQLHQYPATRELMEACLTITVGKPVDLEQGVELMLLQEADRFQHVSSVLLMSLLENAVHDFSLCHNGICIANQLFEGVESIAHVMLVNGLVETLCNVLSAVCSRASAVGITGKPNRQRAASPKGSTRSSDSPEDITGREKTKTTLEDSSRTDEGTPSKDANIGCEGSPNGSETLNPEVDGGVGLRTLGNETGAGIAQPAKVNGFMGSNLEEPDLITLPREESTPSLGGSDVDSGDVDTDGWDGGDDASSVSKDPLPRLPDRLSETVQILIKDIHHFMACIANHVFSSVSQFDYFENMMLLLGGMEEKLRKRHGPSSVIPDIVYDTQCYIVKEVLDHFRATSMSVDSAVTKGKKAMTLQRSVSYSERKYEEYKWKRRNSSDSEAKGSRGRFASTSSITTEFGMSLISESNLDDTMSLSSEQEQLSDFCLQAEDRRYSSQLDTILRMQRVHASSTSSRVPSRKKTPELAGEQLLAKRFQRICLLTVNLVVQRDPSCVNLVKSTALGSPEDGFIQAVDPTFIQLAKQLFHFLTDALAATMERKLGQRKQWESILWSSRDTLRLQLHRLLVHMMAPWQSTPIRVYMLQIACIPRANHILQTVLNSNLQQHLGKFELFLFDLLRNHSQLTEANLVLCQQLMDLLEICGFHPLYEEDMDVTTQDRVKIELEKMITEEQSSQEAHIKQRLDGAVSAWSKLDPFAKEVANSAMEVTQLVTAYQNGQRIRFLEFLRSTIASSLDVRSAWQDLIQSLTHERAVWYDPQTYPSSWQLDPTEGPGRVRRRLQRCHLGIPNKFLLPQWQERHPPQSTKPLDYLFEDSVQSSNSSEFKRRLQKNEKISNAFFCKLVTPASVNTGDLLQGVNSMYFVSEEMPDSSHAQVNPFDRDMMTISWLYVDIKELHLRWYQLRDNALEIFLVNGQTLLLAFENTRERDTLYQQIKSCDLPNLVEVDDISDVTQAWRLGQMTNYEYLTQLNKLAGRSFNDLMQYPVFPFVLSDYTSRILDLENPNSYRDLTKPVAVQSQAMENRYKENYKFLKEEYQKLKGLRMGQTMFWTKPYHYGSHYSNSGTVLQYLVRLPPFTKMFLHYQDNHFDLPDRTFHCVDTSWRLSSYQSSTDVKELIPEFFFLPEFLVNNEGYNFGIRQSGAHVDDVILPPWANGSARLFVLIHRQALESVYASKFLHAWVDLVFGVKQQGSLAVDSINVFHPATYFGIDTTAIKDPVKQRAVETMIKTYGQTPKQLFVNYHPSRVEHDSFVPDNFAIGSVGILAGLSQRPPTKANTGPEASNILAPVNTVKGMRWGNYLGSASGPDPVIRYKKHFPVPLTTLIPLPTGDVCGVAQHLCLLLMYSKERGVSSMNAVDIKWSGIVSWGHPDAILRVQIRRKSLPLNLLHATPTDKITCCSSVSDCRLLFIGAMSGIITAYPTRYNPDKQCNIEVVGAAVQLFGHTACINSLCVSRAYSIMVSSSQDGTCIIWDLNRLCYIRALCDGDVYRDANGVTAVTVSDVSGDIAISTGMADGGSSVSLWTINTSLVSRRLCDSEVHCLAFSNAPEGIAVNSLVAGCEDGVIRFWSTIDLTPIRVLVGNTHSPIISLAFTNDSQYLVASNQDGLVVTWGNKEGSRRAPKMEAFLDIGKIRNPGNNKISSLGSP
ncbi:lysosomal-trafficking regulator-like [Acanthaster planci]|uniref:Lysosomal-trafficking regulator-like n=1 Tax=Acanthaster planci TaxID=133434 RepID=A0A8B8A4S8_ACAPL|nr:lysosomal-trafficking regulator-like [Acanthaster planci]XP_022110936.1 lysosomal-trafficking regulator-like [Acanthaster planci]